MHKRLFILLLIILSSCKTHHYTKPTTIETQTSFLEAGIMWKEAKPNANYDRGEWWKIYNDATLNDLEEKLKANNQSIISAEKAYRSSLALITQARSSYFPTISATQGLTRQRKQVEGSSNNPSYNHTSSQSITLSSSWELDVFNQTGYTVDSSVAQAEANKDNWIYTKLSQQTSLAQYYFEMRALDIDQKMLDDITIANKAALNYAENRYKSGVDDQLDLITYQNNYHSSLQAAQNNKITRQQYQHAIAVLIGQSPSSFTLAPVYTVNFAPVYVPLMIPSQLLERRPDVAQAENLVKQANAQIGIAKSAFFPALSLGASTTWNSQNNHYGPLFSMPQLLWSVGPQLALTLFDGGANFAYLKSIKLSYESQVASYRNTVLSAFQEVEDQLVAVKYLQNQVMQLQKNADNNKKNLKLTENKYKHGIVDYYQVLTAKINYYNSVKSLSDTQSLQKSAEISLIKAIGGGWIDNQEKKDSNS